jgi:hypothetical protein
VRARRVVAKATFRASRTLASDKLPAGKPHIIIKAKKIRTLLGISKNNLQPHPTALHAIKTDQLFRIYFGITSAFYFM